MSDTHINAYFADVDETKSKLDAAKAEHEAAQQRLEDKKKEVGFEEPDAKEVAKETTNSKSDTSNVQKDSKDRGATPNQNTTPDKSSDHSKKK